MLRGSASPARWRRSGFRRHGRQPDVDDLRAPCLGHRRTNGPLGHGADVGISRAGVPVKPARPHSGGRASWRAVRWDRRNNRKPIACRVRRRPTARASARCRQGPAIPFVLARGASTNKRTVHPSSARSVRDAQQCDAERSAEPLRRGNPAHPPGQRARIIRDCPGRRRNRSGAVASGSRHCAPSEQEWRDRLTAVQNDENCFSVKRLAQARVGVSREPRMNERSTEKTLSPVENHP